MKNATGRSLNPDHNVGLLLYEETEECQSGERSGEQGTDGQGESWEALKDKEYSVDDAW